VRLVVDPCPFEASDHLRRALGVSRVMADVLVRRGLADPDEARAFLALRGPQHDPLELGDMAAACDAIESAITDGRKIVVHGDYDVDGICATAVATAVIGALGGTVEPFLPSRFDEGYGLAVETVERLAAEGCGLLVTVDCGITAVAAAARAAELGLALVITDHHRPADELPACPVVAPHGRGEYPADLCGTGVAWKLGEALVARAGADRSIVDRELDLVALATVADIVPLRGENRALVRSGLEALRRTHRPGLDALMRVARCERTRIGATDIGFRLAPRINAAGRLGHPREALELLTTTDERRARELADVLDARNRERQAVEAEILRDALAMAEALPDERRAQRGLVLASPDWHVGVVGIVAARVAERLRRPTVLIALEGEEGRGSGRSLPTFDLHAGLAACAEHLLAWGGHRAAAGVTVRADAVEAFAAAFAAHADATLEDDDLVAVERMDAIVSLSDVSLDLADELAQLEPHGLGNPSVRLLVPGVELAGVATLGQEGKHLRFTARSAAGTCRTVFWGAGGDLARLSQGGRHDLNCRVERNDWNGTSSVQLTARAVLPVKQAPLVSEACTLPGVGAVARAGLHDTSGRGALAELVRLAATGEGLLVVCADAARRRALLSGPLAPWRYGLDGAVVLGTDGCELVAGAIGPRLVGLVSHDALDRAEITAFRHVAILDPPVTVAHRDALAALPVAHVHLVWGVAERTAALRTIEERAPRTLCAAIWKALADGPVDLAQLEPDAAWAAEVLATAGLATFEGGAVRRLDAASRVRLDDVPAYAERAAAHTAALTLVG
jgi:single-stranded-DNA-specific exonuclease